MGRHGMGAGGARRKALGWVAIVIVSGRSTSDLSRVSRSSCAGAILVPARQPALSALTKLATGMAANGVHLESRSACQIARIPPGRPALLNASWHPLGRPA